MCVAVLSKNLNYTRRNMVTANEGSASDINALGCSGVFINLRSYDNWYSVRCVQ